MESVAIVRIAEDFLGFCLPWLMTKTVIYISYVDAQTTWELPPFLLKEWTLGLRVDLIFQTANY